MEKKIMSTPKQVKKSSNGLYVVVPKNCGIKENDVVVIVKVDENDFLK